jgi:myo-inositol-1(or 4)-monophosphatase
VIEPNAADSEVRATDARLIKAVAQEAAELAMHYFHRKVESWDKSPGNPVSEADLALDDLISRRLRGARPSYGWLSEETADDPARLDRRMLWVVDPIDGTRAFLRGRDGFSVSIALVADGAPLLAALAVPARGQLFIAAAGEGATCNGRPLLVDPRTDLPGCRMLADEGVLNARFWPQRWPDMQLDKPNSIALRLAMIAAGEADAAIALTPKSEWDIAAAQLILAEAGGLCTDHHGATPQFNQPRPQVPSIIASGPGLHSELRSRSADGIRAWQARAQRG